jgi:CxxC motif-containing protein (DUF1111 family)
VSCATAGCGADGATSAPPPLDPGPGLDLVDIPLDGATREQIRAFDKGDGLFDLPFRTADGLGPLYIRVSCGSCHEEAVRGPGLVRKMVVTEADGITPSADQSKLPFGHTERPYATAGATVPLVPPDDPSVRISTRVGPPVLGRGYMEAVLDSEIERMVAEQASRGDGIHGHINRVVYASEPNPDTTFGTHAKGEADLIGRFGLKARIVSLDEFTADAFQGDMGITNPLRPVELPNPDKLADDLKTGVDAEAGVVNDVANYLRLIAIPSRHGLEPRGPELFDRALCSACHAPTLKTRADYPIPQIAGIDAPVFTDFLLHDMGDTLADGMTDGAAGPRDWRTAPLIGLRFARTFLHDARASSVEEAILLHAGSGSEASESVQRFQSLADDERRALLAYVGAL